MKKLLFLFLGILLFTTCKKTNTNPLAPVIATLTTTSASAITTTTATSGGNISSDGGSGITARGVCWNTSSSPTVANTKTIDGSGSGSFVSNIIGLTTNTTYYARAYATNGIGTSYGNEINFTTSTEVTIGTQIWKVKNLETTTYRNGDPIPQVTDSAQWANLTTGAWCYYNNDPANGSIYGKLYNWYAVNDPRGLAPQGWHIPSDAEWTTLTTYLGGESVAGGKMKATTLWYSPNIGATNSSGFTGLPGGVRANDAVFGQTTLLGYWWSSTQDGTLLAWGRGLEFYDGVIFRLNQYDHTGYSVRCLKD